MKLGGSGSFRVRVGVSASYSYFRCVRNFDFVYTAAVSVPLAYFVYKHLATISWNSWLFCILLTSYRNDGSRITNCAHVLLIVPLYDIQTSCWRTCSERNHLRSQAASPLRIFFKESLTPGPLRLCVNEKTARVNDSPYFQFKGHTVPLAPIPIKIIKIKNRNTALSDNRQVSG